MIFFTGRSGCAGGHQAPREGLFYASRDRTPERWPQAPPFFGQQAPPDRLIRFAEAMWAAGFFELATSARIGS